jgi:uncharacterized protein YlxW (UPF0749 family)
LTGEQQHTGGSTGGPAREEPAPGQGADQPVSLATRVLFGVGVGLLAVLLVTSTRTAPPEARIGQRVELVELIRAEQARNAELAERVEELSSQLAELEGHGSSAEITVLQEQVAALAIPAGMTAVRGPGVVATLRDSRIAPPPDGDYNDYVIHEEDLQAVINALWSGGAEAMTVNGQRILSTTAIRCVGNVLLLHGTTYSPPYVIEAIGEERALLDALDRDPAVQRFTEAVKAYQLGFTVEEDEELILPGYEGVSAMQVARPVSGARS